MMRMISCRLLMIAMAVPLLAGCGETNLVRDAAQGVGLAGRPSEPADFVRSSRDTTSTGFMAVGVSAPPRPVARRTAEEFRAMERSLEADRARLQAQGAAARQAGTTAPAKPPAMPQ